MNKHILHILPKLGVNSEQKFSSNFNTDGWRLLDIKYTQDGENLILIPNELVKDTENNGLQLYGIVGWQYGIDEIKKICEIYGKGKNAEYAKSIEIEDINEITRL